MERERVDVRRGAEGTCRVGDEDASVLRVEHHDAPRRVRGTDTRQGESAATGRRGEGGEHASEVAVPPTKVSIAQREDVHDVLGREEQVLAIPRDDRVRTAVEALAFELDVRERMNRTVAHVDHDEAGAGGTFELAKSLRAFRREVGDRSGRAPHLRRTRGRHERGRPIGQPCGRAHGPSLGSATVEGHDPKLLRVRLDHREATSVSRHHRGRVRVLPPLQRRPICAAKIDPAGASDDGVSVADDELIGLTPSEGHDDSLGVLPRNVVDGRCLGRQVS
jgi:hypothetical protein